MPYVSDWERPRDYYQNPSRKSGETSSGHEKNGQTGDHHVEVARCLLPGSKNGMPQSERRDGTRLIERTIQFVEIAYAALEDGLERHGVFRVHGEIHAIGKRQIGVERAQLQ
jgi:hypothetical protein